MTNTPGPAETYKKLIEEIIEILKEKVKFHERHMQRCKYEKETYEREIKALEWLLEGKK